MKGIRPQRLETFALAYFRSGNATEAFLETYPHARKWKAHGVHTRASRMLRTAVVQLRLAELREKAETDAVMDRREALKILTTMARGRVQTYLDESGRLDPEKVAKGGADVKEYAESLTDTGFNRRIKLDQQGALAQLAKLQGWDAPTRTDGRSLNMNLSGEQDLGGCDDAEIARRAEAYRRWQDLTERSREYLSASQAKGQEEADPRTLAELAEAERKRQEDKAG